MRVTIIPEDSGGDHSINLVAIGPRTLIGLIKIAESE